MSIFTNIKNYFDNRRRARLESDLRVLASKGVVFNPKHIIDKDHFNPEREFSLRVYENYVWFSAKPYQIKHFYQTNTDISSDLSFFWRAATKDYPKKHSGIAYTISEKMARILFGGGLTTEVEIYQTDDAGNVTDKLDKEKSKKAEALLETIKKKCELHERIRKGAVTESWSGHLFMKLSYDIGLSEYPILEVVDIRNAEIEQERGVTKAIVFKNWFKYGTDDYVHKERYTTNEQGFAKIENKVFKISPNRDEIEVPLDILQKAFGLKEPVLPEYVFDGLKGMLAFEKPNRIPNPEFSDSPYGASDYFGAISAFDGLDEVLSEIFAEVRNNKTIRYIPAEFLEYTKDGDLKGINNFVQNYVVTKTLLDQNAKNEINITPIPDKMESLVKKWQTALATCCYMAGISPVALGIPGIESIDSAADSQQERNKATLETRSEKIKLWKPFLEGLILQLLALNSWMQKKFPEIQKNEDRLDIDFDNCNVIVKFGDYIVEKQSEKINTWGTAKSQGVASTREAVKNIHPDWDDARIDEEVNLIRYEQGMSLDNPQNLPELTGFAEEEEDEEENEQGDGGSVDEMINKIERDKQKQEKKTE